MGRLSIRAPSISIAIAEDGSIGSGSGAVADTDGTFLFFWLLLIDERGSAEHPPLCPQEGGEGVRSTQSSV